MSEIKDGGPAFPREDYQINGGGLGQQGMSLRDWFAGQALNDACRRHGHAPAAAERAYEIADAMLRARGEE